MKITTPSMSNRKQRFSICSECFSRVWYVADNERQITAANMKIEKIIKSAAVTPEYLLARYFWINHSPSRKTTAGMRWE